MVGHAARWSPSASRELWHDMHVCGPIGRGKRKRRLTLIRSAHAPGVDAALVDEKKRAGLVVTA